MLQLSKSWTCSLIISLSTDRAEKVRSLIDLMLFFGQNISLIIGNGDDSSSANTKRELTSVIKNLCVRVVITRFSPFKYFTQWEKKVEFE